MEIKDKVIIVTGASKGIGHETAKLLSARGAKVVLAARSKDALVELEKELAGSFAVQTDMTKTEDVKNLIQKSVEKFGRIDVLINCAGQGMWATIAEGDLEEYKRVVDLNVFGYLRAMQAVVPVMRKQGEGMILNVSSMVTRDFIPNLGLYSSTKYAVNSLSFTARKELEKDNIKVCVIRPKLVDTNFGKHAASAEPDFLRDWNNPNHPPMDKPQDVAEKIAELIGTGAVELDM